MVSLGAVVTDVAPATPVKYGLLSPAVTVINDDDPHWINGFSYPTLHCSTEVTLRSICNASVAVTAIPESDSPRWRQHYPFGLQTTYKCSTMGRRPGEIEQLALDHADACTQKALEFEFWTGTLARAEEADGSWNDADNGPFPNRYLASDDAIDITPTPGTGIRAKHALALLEGALGDCGCGTVGTMHMTRETASALGYKGDGELLTTPLGTPIVAGAGYTGSGPGDVMPTAGRVWMYATSPVTVRLGEAKAFPTKPGQSVNIATNEIEYFVDKPGAATWDACCHFAVLVDLTLDYA